jgi:NOL1/NOP2/sun family putative RNA methylase
LEESQQEHFPYVVDAFGVEITVQPGVFSPKHFHGWEVFTRHFPDVRGEDILEVGSGTGVTSLVLARRGARRIVAVDINPDAVENTRLNAERNKADIVEVRLSDVFSGISTEEAFDTIYWNLPFIHVPRLFEYQSDLERALFDPGYSYTERFLKQARRHSRRGGRLLLGLGDFADLPRIRRMARRFRYHVALLAQEDSEEGGQVQFQLYELRPFATVFYAQPFTGRTYEEIVAERRALRSAAAGHDLELLEQFDGVEEEEPFRTHGYSPLFVVEKDRALLTAADYVIADFNGPSLGRDAEVTVAKEVLDKRVIAVVADQHLRRHPTLRLYSDYVEPTAAEALALASRLSAFRLPNRLGGMTRRQKDQVDQQLWSLLERSHGLGEVESLLPAELRFRWQELLGGEYGATLDWSFRRLPRTIRTNPLRANDADVARVLESNGVPVLPHPIGPGIFRVPWVLARNLGGLKEHADGWFYIQELASMLPAIALAPQPGETVLDLGAAPGSKTTQIAGMMGNRGRIVAVDASSERIEAVRANAARLGVSIIELRLVDGRLPLRSDREAYDRVLVDGPCSCEGILRYKPHKLFEWDLGRVSRFRSDLAGLLAAGFAALKPGGTLVYSTCTLGPEENEGVVDGLLRSDSAATLEDVSFAGLRLRPGLRRWHEQRYDRRVVATRRLYPQDNDTIGFYLAKIRKKM